MRTVNFIISTVLLGLILKVITECLMTRYGRILVSIFESLGVINYIQGEG